MSELVELRNFPNELFARMAADYLANQEIETFIQKDDCGGLYPQMQLAYGVKLMVDEEDLEKANTLLEEEETKVVSDEEDGFDEEDSDSV